MTGPTAILSALPEEQHGLADLLEGASLSRHAGRDLWAGRLNERPVLLALCGVGKVSAATTATMLIERFKVGEHRFYRCRRRPRRAGAGRRHRDCRRIAAARHRCVAAVRALRGALHRTLALSKRSGAHGALAGGVGTVVRIGARRRRDAVGGSWCGPCGWCAWPGCRNRRTLCPAPQPSAHAGLLIAGDRFVATAAESAALRRLLPDALAVDMESAAVAQVCWDYGVPFAVMRTVSDRADDAAHVDFPAFLAQVASSYARGVIGSMLAMQ